MKDQKITLGFETPADEAHHDTHIIHTTVSELRREVAARFETILDDTDSVGGQFQKLWDAIDCCECDNFWVSDADDEIRLQGSVVPILFSGDRPVMVLYDWLKTTSDKAFQLEARR